MHSQRRRPQIAPQSMIKPKRIEEPRLLGSGISEHNASVVHITPQMQKCSDSDKDPYYVRESLSFDLFDDIFKHGGK